MRRIIKQTIVLLVIVNLFVLSGWSPVFAQDQYQENERSGEKMAADALLLRPTGFLATILGSAVFIVSLPLSLLGKNHKEAFDEMVKKPAECTFVRPLGDV
jgi:hypothetical protein